MNEIIEITLLSADTNNLWVDFKEHLEEVKKKKASTTAYSSYGAQNKELKDDRKIWFYEESDITRLPLKFEKVSEFQQWAEGCRIFMSEYTLNTLRGNEYNYVTCYKGTPTVMIRQNYSDLKLATENYEKYHNSYHPYHSYGDVDYDDDDYASIWF